MRMERMTRQAVAAVEREEGGKNTGTPEINTDRQKKHRQRSILQYLCPLTSLNIDRLAMDRRSRQGKG